ncbi:ATP-binding cassette sub-family G member 5-like isoform X1 [Mya arenaria]|uniref:ATP-binding cassette sub-family G member 5-like isoform X1 n=1 Tax=Mya arenaria TaxID=6604 RepID=UPI0022E80A51|nr:ATP-binding cassette sub-family G member 5-like isoform X1 [Mya arenaria]
MAVNGISGKIEDATNHLDVLNLKYVVRDWVGPWWKGACFRKLRHKCIINDVTLRLKSGEITGILGNSGSGKTSLLDVITCRASGKVTGDVIYNGTRCTNNVIQNHATYVMQADRFLPNLTVRETLIYSAKLRLPGCSTSEEIEKRVTDVVLAMGLKDVADTRIGGSIIRGISGGERRRVTIAIQLLKDPDSILLDEPTSGLDSYTARHLVSNLRDLARRGKIVMLSLHQPSSDIYSLLDRIGIMSKGEFVYFGCAKGMVQYFTEVGYPCDKYTNPLDRYVDVASMDRRDKDSEIQSLIRVERLVKILKTSRLQLGTFRRISDDFRRGPRAGNREAVERPGSARVLVTVIRRMYRNLFRDRADYMLRFFFLPAFCIMIIAFMGRIGTEPSSVQNRMGMLYLTCAFAPYVSILNASALFPSIRDQYFRERRDGLYGALTLLLAYTVHVLPCHVVSSVLFSAIVYWSTGLHPGQLQFIRFTAVVFLNCLWSELHTAAFHGIFLSANLAQAVTGLCLSSYSLVATGFLKELNSLMKPLQWVSKGLIQKYSAELLAANEFHGLRFDCPEIQLSNVTSNLNVTYNGAYF